MSEQTPIDTFPEEMTITRGLVQRLNEDIAPSGDVPSAAVIAAMIETVGIWRSR